MIAGFWWGLGRSGRVEASAPGLVDLLVFILIVVVEVIDVCDGQGFVGG